MADTPLSSQMEAKYKVSKWNRNTVADGSWLQKYTIEKLKDRDIFLANHIYSATGDLTSALEAEIAARKEGDTYISGVLDTVSSDFYTFSSKVETSASTIVSTINEFSANFEASASYLEDKIDAENERAKSAETDLADKISTLEAATDVIMVYGTYSSEDPNVSADTFVDGSALLWEDPGYLTENDVIKVLIDNSTVSSNQTYYKATNVDHETSSCDWTKIGSLEPYYSTWAIDDKFTDAYDYLDDNFLKADNTAVSGGHNIVVDKPNENIPAVRIQTSSHVTFTGVSSTNLSAVSAIGSELNYTSATATYLTATNASAKNISGEKLFYTTGVIDHLSADDISANSISSTIISANAISSNTLDAKTARGTSAIFNGVSAQEISATNVYSDYVSSISSKTEYLTANSAKGWYASYMSGNFTYLGGVNVTAGNLTATTAKISGLSALNISGNGKSSTVSGLILSSQSGAWASAVLNSAYWSATNGTNGNSGLIGKSFAISAGANLGLSVDGSAIKISGTPAGIVEISAKDNGITTAFTNSGLLFSAGEGIDLNGTTDNTIKISAESGLLGSANSGQSAYNWITSKSATLSAGSGIEFASAQGVDNTLGIYVTGVLFESSFSSWVTGTNSLFSGTSRSAKSAGSAELAYSASLANSAATAYNAQNLGGITSTDIINSAKSGYAASSWIATHKQNIESASAKATDAYNVLSSATFSAKNTVAGKLSAGFYITGGPGVYINTATNGSKSGIYISAEGKVYNNGNYISIDTSDNNKINLNSAISATNISAETIYFPGNANNSGLLNTTALSYSSKNQYGPISAYYGYDYMYLSAGGRPGNEIKITPSNFTATYLSNSYDGLWKEVATASKLTGSNYIGITTSNIDSYYHITLSSNISALYLSAYNINQEYTDNTYTARLSSNADSVEMWQHTQGQHGNTTGIAKWSYIIRNNETRNGTMAKMNSGDYISSNSTITAIVTAANVGGTSNVLYLV